MEENFEVWESQELSVIVSDMGKMKPTLPLPDRRYRKVERPTWDRWDEA